MKHRQSIMLTILNQAIATIGISDDDNQHGRSRVLKALRAEHFIFVRAQMYTEAWCTVGLISMLEDTLTVNDVWRELRAATGETPHSNRGVTSRIASSFTIEQDRES